MQKVRKSSSSVAFDIEVIKHATWLLLESVKDEHQFNLGSQREKY